MPEDIFDQVAPQSSKGDIFDKIAAPPATPKDVPLKPVAAFNGPQQIHQDYLNKWLPNLDSAPSKTYHDLINSDPSKWPDILRGYSSVGRDALLFAAQAYKKQPTTMRAANAADTGRPVPEKTPLVYDPSDPLGYAQAKAQEQQAAGGFANQAVGKAKEFLAGAVDPRMLALEVATGGAGSAIQGATGARALLQASPLLRAVPPAARATAGTVFGTQMARNAYQEYKAGRPGSAVVSGLAGLLGLAGAGKEILGKGSSALEPPPAANEPAATPSARETPQAPSPPEKLAPVSRKLPTTGDTIVSPSGVEFEYGGKQGTDHIIKQPDTGNAYPVTREELNKFTRKPQEVQPNALPQSQAGEILQRQPEEAGGAGGTSGGVEPGVQGQETPGQGQGQEAQVGGGDTTGIAQRVHEQRAAAGQIGEILPGVGSTGEKMTARGKELIAQGTDPNKTLADAQARGFAGPEEMAVLRAEGENYTRATNQAADKFGVQSPEYQAARQTETGWYDTIKPFSTEAHKLFVAHQGVTDVDTGDWHSLRRAFEDTAGREVRPEESVVAQQHARTISDLNDKLTAKQSQIDALIQAQSTKRNAARPAKASELPTDPALLKDALAKRMKDGTLWAGGRMSKEAGAIRASNDLAPDVVRAIWNHAKANYVGMGNAPEGRSFNFNEVVAYTADDLGLPPEIVRQAFSQNKSVRTVTDEMFQLQSDRRRAIQAAKAWVANADKSKARQFVDKLERFPSAEAVLGHGGVGMVTHAGKNLLEPMSWKSWWPAFKAQYRMSFGKNADVFHEKMMEDIERGPQYAFKVRSGLAIEPNVTYEDYQNYGKVLGWLGRRGNQGMDALKLFRDKYFDDLWSKVPKGQQTPEMGKFVADLVNGASGKGSLRKGRLDVTPIAQRFLFAPALEAGRWKSTVGDPIEVAKTVATWKTATPEARLNAIMRMKRAGRMTGMYAVALAANQALLSSSGSKEGVNWNDPTKPDWLRFKTPGGMTIDPFGNYMAPIKYMASVVKIARESPQDLKGDRKRDVELREAGRYLQNKLAPQWQILADFAMGENSVGKLMPFSQNPTTTPSGNPKTPKEQFTWGEYAAEHTPIPMSEGFRAYFDGMREAGASEDQTNHILKGIGIGIAAMTGARFGNPPRQYKSKLDLPPELKSAMKTPKLPTFQSMMRGQ